MFRTMLAILALVLVVCALLVGLVYLSAQAAIPIYGEITSLTYEPPTTNLMPLPTGKTIMLMPMPESEHYTVCVTDRSTGRNTCVEVTESLFSTLRVGDAACVEKGRLFQCPKP